MARHSVTATSVTRTVDRYGDATTTTTTATVTGLRFAPEGYVENVTSSSPTVVGDASLYGILPALDADDTIEHADTCCDGSDFAFGSWQVVGGTKGWGSKKVCPIRRTAVS
ncbi:MAG: hypothetical protein ACXVXP_00105 [Mycobacteriaceae bacterium]